MTSPAPVPGDDAAPGQEGIWDTAPEGSDGGEAGDAPRARRDRAGVTGSITSTRRTPGPAGLYYADVPNRIIAMVIDIVVLALVGTVLALLFGGLATDPGSLDRAGGDLELVPFLIVVVLQLAVSLAYFGYSWTAFGGTLGMHVLGLRVGDEIDGRRIGWRAATIRWLILGIPSILASLGAFVPGVVGILLTALGLAWLGALLYTIGDSPTRQGVHDRLAHTIVVKAERRAA